MAYPKKFRPKTAVAILADENSEPVATAVKTMALAELIVWCLLDQDGRKKGKPKSPNKKHYINTTAALRTRSLVAALLLDRQVKTRVDEEVTGPLLTLVAVTGGFSALTNGISIKSMLRRIRNADTQARYVAEIVRYLVLCRAEPDGSKHATIDNAKKFVEEVGPKLGLTAYKFRTISKFWETSAPAAPLIFALCQEPTFRPSLAKDEKVVLKWLTAFVSSPHRVGQLLGLAASVLDLLKGPTRRQRESDLTDVVRQALNVRPFNAIERSVHDKIVSTDPNAPIYEPVYRPKVISKRSSDRLA